MDIASDFRLTVLQEAEKLFDPETFNRLVDSVHATVEKGRLRFWQEQLLEQLSRVTNLRLNFQEFAAVFRDAPRKVVPKIPVLKDDFLQTPNKFLHSGKPYDIPEVWVIETLKS